MPWALLVVAVAVGAYVWLYGSWTVRNHRGLATFGFDLGIFDQGVWLLSRFREPFVTVRGLHLFGDHTSFFLLLLVPLYWVVPSASTLLVAQTAALGSGGVAAFLLARRVLGDQALATLVALAYLATPAVGWINWENFHPDAFIVPLTLFAFFFAASGRWAPFLVTVSLVLLVKEDVPLLTLPLGLYVAAVHHRRVGLLVAGLSLVWLALALWVVLPAFGPGPIYASRLAFGGPMGLARAVLDAPTEVLRLLAREGRPWYVWQLLAPAGLLPLLAPETLLVGLPALLANLLSTFPYQFQLHYHYSAPLVPVAVAAAVLGVARVPSPRLRAGLVVLMVAAAFGAANLWGPTPWSRSPGFLADVASAQARERMASVRRAVALIPPDASVSAHYLFVPHLTHRVEIYEFPNPWRGTYWGDYRYEGRPVPVDLAVDYVILPADLAAHPDYREVLARIRPQYVGVYRSAWVQLLRRRPAPGGVPDQEAPPGG